MIESKKFKVERIVYYDQKGKWGVLATTPVDDLGPIGSSLLNKYGNISVVGNFEGMYAGAEFEASGSIVDGKYGKSLQLRTFRIIQDTNSREGVVNFLARSLINGISVQNAKKIYDAFKEKSIDTVLNHPDKLNSVKGIAKKTVAKVTESVSQYKKRQPLIDHCTKLGLSYSLIMKLDEELGNKALNTIIDEPYKILELTNNISFKQVDDIFLRGGGSPTATVRLETALLHALKREAMLEGSTGCKSARLKSRFYKLINLDGDNSEYESIAFKLSSEGKIYITEGAITGYETGYVYYKPYVDIERNIAEKVEALNKYGVLNPVKESVVDEEIHDFPFDLNDKQVEAVHSCLQHNVSVLTGAAGSGKSSITKALTNIYARSGFNVELLSPTAKACRRLEECVGGYKAQTIHKFLGMTKDGEFNSKQSYNKDTVLVIDEASMMDIMLFNNLLLGTNLSSRVLLIGDNNQLPSVQAGNVLGDMISSEKVHVSLLTDVMRQQEDSHIIKFCNMINKGEVFEPCSYDDFHYEEFGEGSELIEFFLPHYLADVKEYGLNEVQVISPYKKGELGMDNMNSFIQESYNKDGAITVEPFRIGDKVRHTQNNYKKGVFNGETGTIVSYNEEDEDRITVDYGDKFIEYTNKDIDELTLSYCSTVHSSQGSEYKIVYVILDDTAVNDFLHIRRLLYTAVSRGKQKVYILSKPYLVDNCINNDSYRPRITKLAEFLKEVEV